MYEVLSPLRFEVGRGKNDKGREVPSQGPIRQPGEKVDLEAELEPNEIQQLVDAGIVKPVLVPLSSLPGATEGTKQDPPKS